MKKLLVLFVFVLCLFVSRAYSQNNRWVYAASDGHDFDVYYDTETIKYNGNKITVNIKYKYYSESEKYWDMNYSIAKEIYYCGKEQRKGLFMTTYYRNGKITTTTLDMTEDIIPDSVAEALYISFCK